MNATHSHTYINFPVTDSLKAIITNQKHQFVQKKQVITKLEKILSHNVTQTTHYTDRDPTEVGTLSLPTSVGFFSPCHTHTLTHTNLITTQMVGQ